MDFRLENKFWWGYLHEDLQELLNESVMLYDIVGKWEQKFHDYSFVVFPAAKAYEGFLKKVFLDLGFITKEDFYGKRFRVGKALNPSLDKKYVSENVYNKIVDFCKGPKLADTMWETWRSSRNLLFHWFPEEKNAISFNEAGGKINLIVSAMDLVSREFKIDKF